jgi:hypothetical protein
MSHIPINHLALAARAPHPQAGAILPFSKTVALLPLLFTFISPLSLYFYTITPVTLSRAPSFISLYALQFCIRSRCAYNAILLQQIWTNRAIIPKRANLARHLTIHS